MAARLSALLAIGACLQVTGFGAGTSAARGRLGDRLKMPGQATGG
jgi:hypothetical protein